MKREKNISGHRFLLSTGYLAALAVVFLGLFTSCEEERDWIFQEQTWPGIVVNALITDEFKQQEVQLSRPVSRPGMPPPPVTGATVWIGYDTTKILFEEVDTLPGLYRVPYPGGASLGVVYRLNILIHDTLYHAIAYMVPVLGANPPLFDFHADTGLYTLNWNNPKYSPNEEAMYVAEIDWSHVSGYENAAVNRARLTFYTLSTIDVNYLILPKEKEKVWFPAGATVTVKKYSLNPEHGAWVRALLAETEWQGSLFEDSRGNLPGNISNGGLGFFGVSAVITATYTVGE